MCGDKDPCESKSQKRNREQYDCLSFLGVRNKMPHCFSKPTFGPFQGPEMMSSSEQS